MSCRLSVPSQERGILNELQSGAATLNSVDLRSTDFPHKQAFAARFGF